MVSPPIVAAEESSACWTSILRFFLSSIIIYDFFSHCLLFASLFSLTLFQSDHSLFCVLPSSPLLAPPPTRWLRPVLEPTAAPITAAAAAAQPAGSSSVKRTSTFVVYRQPPPTMTWSSSASREYHPILTFRCNIEIEYCFYQYSDGTHSDPLVNKCFNAKFLQIHSNEEINSSTS